jgi:hypothetical protein
MVHAEVGRLVGNPRDSFRRKDDALGLNLVNERCGHSLLAPVRPFATSQRSSFKLALSHASCKYRLPAALFAPRSVTAVSAQENQSEGT